MEDLFWFLPMPQADQDVYVVEYSHSWDVTYTHRIHEFSSRVYQKKFEKQTNKKKENMPLPHSILDREVCSSILIEYSFFIQWFELNRQKKKKENDFI